MKLFSFFKYFNFQLKPFNARYWMQAIDRRILNSALHTLLHNHAISCTLHPIILYANINYVLYVLKAMILYFTFEAQQFKKNLFKIYIDIFRARAIAYQKVFRPKFFRREFFHAAGLPFSGTWRATRRGVKCTRDQVLEHPEERPRAFHGPAVRATRRSIGDGLPDPIPESGRTAQAIRGDQGRGRRCRQLSL